MARLGRVTATLVAALLLASGCLEKGPEEPTVVKTPIGKLDTASTIIPRKAFCEKVPMKAVEAALTAPVDNAKEWTNGSQGTTGDVAQEFGCEWKSADGFAARAWVYARPVTKQYAGEVIAKTSTKALCRSPRPPKFGVPSQVQVCQLGGGVLRVRHAGLFGDAFLTCELSEPTADFRRLRLRTGEWCVDVVKALDTND